MRLRLTILAIALALVVVVVAVRSKQNVTEFTSAEYKFKTKFPSTPKESEEAREGIKFKEFSTPTKDGAYTVRVVESVPPNLPPEAISQRLDEARDAEVRSMNGNLISSTPIKLADKYPGRDFTVERPGKGTYRVRTYIVGARYYHVSASGAGNYATTPEATAFLDSFQLME